METKKEIKSIIMISFDYGNRVTIFVTNSFKDQDLVHNTITTVAKMMDACLIKIINDNVVHYIDTSEYSSNAIVDERIAKHIYQDIVNDQYEIWI